MKEAEKKNEKDDKEWSSGRNQRRSPESHWSFRPTTTRRRLLLRLPGFLGDFGGVLSSQRALVRWKRSKLSSKRPISAARFLILNFFFGFLLLLLLLFFVFSFFYKLSVWFLRKKRKKEKEEKRKSGEERR